jgi:hypothetical protein
MQMNNLRSCDPSRQYTESPSHDNIQPFMLSEWRILVLLWLNSAEVKSVAGKVWDWFGDWFKACYPIV